MGLDMYLAVTTGRTDDKGRKELEQLHYWRKHNAMHHWFEQLAISRGLVNSVEDFNCVKVPLSREDLDRLECDIISGKLEPEAGFFFGPTDYDPKEDMGSDLLAVAKARQALAAGKEVFYDSWW
jgi:hypothetical protein